MRVRIKICGITSQDDARAAIDAGADALGFMLFEGSPRNVKLTDLHALLRGLPPFVARVGVFVDPAEKVVRQAIEAGVDTLQFHGNETPEFCALFDLPVYKAFRIQAAAPIEQMLRYATNAWLLDTYVPGQMGGTGKAFQWDAALAAIALGRPVILAGGLTPENVGEAVGKVAPYGVDVSSGVESAPGRKDSEKMKLFVKSAQQVAARL